MSQGTRRLSNSQLEDLNLAEIVNGFYNSTQSIPTNTPTVLNNWTLRHSSTSKMTLGNDRITFNVSGKFLVAGCCVVQGNIATFTAASATYSNFLHKNAANVSQANYHMAGFGGQHAGSCVINVQAGDYVQMEAFQNSGSSQPTGNTTNVNHFTCAYLGE